MEVAKDEASLRQSARILHSIQRGIRRVKFPNILQLANVSRLAQTLKKTWPRFPPALFSDSCNDDDRPLKMSTVAPQQITYENPQNAVQIYFFSFLNMWRVLCEQFKLFSSHPHPIFFFWVNKELNQWPVETNEKLFFFFLVVYFSFLCTYLATAMCCFWSFHAKW